jgi:hypothetical protein
MMSMMEIENGIGNQLPTDNGQQLGMCDISALSGLTVNSQSMIVFDDFV